MNRAIKYLPSLFDQPKGAVILDIARGKELARAGMELAVDTANAEHKDWSTRCWQLFFQWLNRKPRYFEFMIEDFRLYLDQYGLLEKPKSERAFGFLSGKAVRRNMIEFVRKQSVKNIKAHSANASVWRKK